VQGVGLEIGEEFQGRREDLAQTSSRSKRGEGTRDLRLGLTRWRTGLERSGARMGPLGQGVAVSRTPCIPLAKKKNASEESLAQGDANASLTIHTSLQFVNKNVINSYITMT
jgi:hypothetical protein